MVTLYQGNPSLGKTKRFFPYSFKKRINIKLTPLFCPATNSTGYGENQQQTRYELGLGFELGLG